MRDKGLKTKMFALLLLAGMLSWGVAAAQEGEPQPEQTQETQETQESEGTQETEETGETQEPGSEEPPTAPGQKQGKGKEKNLRILYEGLLTDSEGGPVEEGSYNLRFTIFDSKEGGSILWQEPHIYYDGISVKEGGFRVVLGRANPLNLDLSEAPFWLGVEVGEETENGIVWQEEIKPRKEITTLSKLLEGEEFSEESWAEVERMIEARLEEEGELIILMDMETLGGVENKGRLDSDFIKIFKQFIDFLSEKISQINARLTLVLEKLDSISSTLANMQEKVNALYAALVVNQGALPQTVPEQKTELSPTPDPELVPKDKGRAAIQEGEEVVKIISSVIKKESKVFVTFLDNPDTSWWVSQKKPGEFFVVSLHAPAEKNIEFDYWVVEGGLVEEQGGTGGGQEEEEGCTPGQEVCDGEDNDCDGEVDEELTRGCGQEVGACETGTQVCSEGVWGECEGAVWSVQEVCDGEDNDCDGEIDEEGVCEQETGGAEEGQEETQDQGCTPGQEVCDEKDNDCDGEIDEEGVCEQETEQEQDQPPVETPPTENATNTEKEIE